MPRPDCPRCGSHLTIAAPSGAPSVLVMELRGETVPVPATDSFQWLCRSCGHRWDPSDEPEEQEPEDLPTAAEPDGPRIASERPNPGLTLMRARHEAGKTLAEASRGTGVWERHLQALETDAPPGEFPSHAIARLYLREYARYLRLDPKPLLQELDELHPAEDGPVLEPPPARRGRWKALATVLAVLTVIALAVIAIRQTGSRPRPVPTSPRAEQPAVVPAGGGGAPASPVPAPVRGIRATLALSQPSWVQAVADGEVVAAVTLEPGTRVSYRAKRTLELTLGNAGGVHLRVNREPVRTGTPGEVVTLALRWRDGVVSLQRS